MAALDMKNMNLMGIIGLVGALLLVIGVFLTWIEPSSGSGTAYSGWEIFNNKYFAGYEESVIPGTVSHVSGIGIYHFMPLFALICGIISLALMILPTFINTEKFAKINNVLGIVALVLAIVVVIFCILMMNAEQSTWATVAGHDTNKLTFKLISDNGFKFAIGYYLTLVGAIITAVGGIMPILKNKGIIKF